MKSICFYFQIHQPFRLRRYRFFDIGSDHYYYDDYNNEEIIRRIAEHSYLPANQTILQMINESKGKFKVAYSISGVALEQFELYVPEVIDSFRELAQTGSVEFLAETYAHSLSSLVEDSDEFELQVKKHTNRIESLFGVKPKVFRNTELIYSDEIGERVARLGFKGMITEGAKHVLGWKSPNYVYCCATNPRLNILLKNFKLSDDIAFRFSDWRWDQYPLKADKFIDWIAETPESEKVINLFMNYETFGELQHAATGIFEFLKALPYFAKMKGISFATPTEIIEKNKPVDRIQVTYPISWADEERDVSAWLGNELQREAFNELYGIGERVRLSRDRRLMQDWDYLQTSDHFYYMSTKHFSDGAVHSHYSPYDSPYEAFMNYMNVLSDFIDRVNAQFPEGMDNEELNSLMQTITAQEEIIEQLREENEVLKKENTPVKKTPKKRSSSSAKKGDKE
jgi:alpha-amylase